MMNSRILLFALLLPISLMAEETVVTLDRGQAYEFTWNAQTNHWVARVYVTPKAELLKSPIQVGVKSVALGSRTDPGLTGLLQVSNTQIGPPLTSFDIQAPKNAAVLPGTYQATLTFIAGKAQQTANIQLSIPAAVLTGPTTLQLTRVLYPLSTETSPKLEIWETSGKSFADIQASQTEPFAGSDSQFSGQILMDGASVTGNGHAALNYSLNGEFPLGASSAKVTISSRQLQSPLVIPVTVRTRLGGIVLLILIITGLTLGFLMRMVLKPRIETGEARQRAFEAYNTLLESAKIPDAKCKKAIGDACVVLQKATQAKGATSISIADAIKTAEASRQKALSDLQNDLKDAEAKINELAEVVTPAWNVPTEIAKTVTVGREAIETAKRFLEKSDAGEALKTVTSAKKHLLDSLVGKNKALSTSAAHLLKQLEQLEELIESDQAEQFVAARKALEDQVPNMQMDPKADQEAVKPALETLHRFMSTLPQFLRKAADEVKAAFAGMDDVIKDIALREKELWNQARESTAGFFGLLNSIPVDSLSQWQNLDLNPNALRTQWRTALVSQKPEATGVATDFDDRKYQSAARKLADALLVRKAPATTLGSAQPAPQLESEVAVPAAYVSPTALAIPTAPGGQVAAPNVGAKPFADFGATSLRELIRAKASQAVLSGVALTIVGYLIFADKFVGTSSDLLSAFFWGFTTDIGVDALLTAAKPK